MINVNEASARAIEHLKKLYPDHDLGKILFEEAEMTDDDKFWVVVLSYKSPIAASGGWQIYVCVRPGIQGAQTDGGNRCLPAGNDCGRDP